MKKLALILGVAAALTSCSKEGHNTYYSNGTDDVFVVNIQGHDYLIYRGYSKGGICHSESCKCKNK